MILDGCNKVCNCECNNKVCKFDEYIAPKNCSCKKRLIAK